MTNKTATRQQPIWRQAQLVRAVTLSDSVGDNLLMGGIVLRQKKQLPVIDCAHSRNPSATLIYGSIRNLRIDQNKLVGELRWASDADSQKTRAKYESGLLTLRLDVDVFETATLLRGQQHGPFTGPCSVVARWQPLSVSLVASRGTR